MTNKQNGFRGGEMKIQCIIIDDEKLARRGLEIRLADVEDIEIVGYCANGREALAMIREKKPDLIFLDIQMPGLSGFDVLRELKGGDLPMVVFVTAFDQYAIKAFEAHALDYLLKPIDDSRLHQALYHVRRNWDQRRAIKHRTHLMELIMELSGEESIDLEAVLANGPDALSARYLKKLPIKDGKNTVCLTVSDIDWIDAAGDYMCVHADGVTHILRGTMKRLEDGLDPRTFQRVHRSTIVNIHRVKSLRSHINGEYFLSLAGGNEVKMSRHYKEKVKYFVASH